MASTERSLGWATSGTGDGVVTGYDSSRWRANAQKSDGNGLTLYGSYIAMTGVGTGTLTIADGAAIISGITYETNGTVTISTTGLTTTYNALLIANTTGASLTVSANGAGTLLVAVATVRIALATTAQTATITTAVGAGQVITLGTVAVTAGLITTIIPAYPYANTMTVASQVFAVLDSISVTSITNTLTVDIAGYVSSATSGEGLITADTVTGFFTVATAGTYLVEVMCAWDSSTIGSRVLGVNGSGIVHSQDFDAQSILASAISYQSRQQYSRVIRLTAGAVVKAIVLQNSGTTRTISNALFKIVRL